MSKSDNQYRIRGQAYKGASDSPNISRICLPGKRHEYE
jgi:hypothetical protein